VDEEIVKLRDLEGVSSIVVTHQLRDAFYIAGHTATRNGGLKTLSADQNKSEEAEFIMLRDGVIAFEGPSGELKRSTDPYLLHFLS
jgi:phospholipid/cholesterol/gamma-HCH transport system ATP-binding protein